MPVAHWCLLVTMLLPYCLSLAARSGVSRSTYLADPRAYSETLNGWRRRAHHAHLNAFEAVPALLAGVLVAELAEAPRVHVDSLSFLFVAVRVLHAGLYIADRPVLRSAAWKIGILCVVGLFVDAATFGRQ
jgi:uncharacterized MAPEG superfamily protein